MSPVVISFKILFQELCRCKVEWDEALPEALRSKWELLLEGLRAAHLRVPRCCLSGSGSTLRLVGFCDASTKAYVAVVYLVSERMLMASKTRVAPLKPQTVPRLELLGALLLARLMTSVKCALRRWVTEWSCFTDSLVVLHWIKGTDQCWKPFVQNRVREIREKLESSGWHHCEGRSNPADLPSRGVSFVTLNQSFLWFHGPDWLAEEDRVEFAEPMPAEWLGELCAKDREVLTLSAFSSNGNGVGAIMDVNRFSSFEKLIHSTAYLLLFLGNLKT